jgi:hypothetical protein
VLWQLLQLPTVDQQQALAASHAWQPLNGCVAAFELVDVRQWIRQFNDATVVDVNAFVVRVVAQRR